MSNKIKNLGASREEEGVGEPPGPRQELLLRRIHTTASAFLKEHVLTLPKLPSHSELKELQERRRLEAEARLAAEKEAGRQAEARAAEILRRRGDRDSPRPLPPNRTSPHHHPTNLTPRRLPMEEVVVDTGWGADSSAHNVTETDDPLIQQMNIIRNYIKQAR
ncbi:Rabenosyn-5 [Chionoecetes opilio]|uniref:Rabenosyn-5 n=1 Tax=Chionoecetes opilio TaxID=41210 RepID=A0A8J4Y0C3_CHIOP|nr:Rabenosyn-5 [Chionoecetes opilio]